MAFDAFLKIDEVLGESRDDKHRDEIELLSYTFGVEQVGSTGFGGGAGAGKAVFGDFQFSAPVNLSSSVLFQACATGQHFKKAVLTCRKSGGEQQHEFLKVTMTDVLISQYSNGGDTAAELPMDQIGMHYAKIEMVYTSPGPRGDVSSAAL
jgi:type VI secretion system secreted protein Hcp